MSIFTANINIRRDIAASFTSANPTLQLGEIAHETDTGNFKIGTGSTAWTSLQYINSYKSTASCPTTSVGIGNAAARLLTSGANDTAVGSEALREITSGGDNTGIGSRAGQNITTGGQNTCIGNRAGQGISTGSENVYIGHQAGVSAGTSGSQVCVGVNAGRDLNSTSSSNTLIGKEAAVLGTTLYQCVAVGLQALGSASTASPVIENVTAIGTQSLRFTQTGVHTAVGASTLYNNTTGVSNTAIGFQALLNNSTGSYNTALGNQALVANQTGTRNVALGEYCMDGNRGDDNVAAGINAGYRKWTGNDNVMIGDSAAAGKISGAFLAFSMADNVVIGSGAYLEPAGSTAAPTVTFTAGSPGKVNLTNSFANNTIVSFAAGSTLPSIVGGGILTANTSYFVRNVTGSNFEISLTSGGTSINLSTTGSGTHTLIYATAAGDGNTVVGRSAGALMTTGANNVFMGKEAGDLLTTGSNNVCVGYQADPATATTSNTVTLGNASIATLRCQVTTITSLSDQRDKKDISDLSSVMPFVNALRPRSFVWNMRDGAKVGIPEIGFIAQELQSAQQDVALTVPNLVNAENPDRLEAGYGALIPILVKAIQELSAKVAALEAQ